MRISDTYTKMLCVSLGSYRGQQFIALGWPWDQESANAGENLKVPQTKFDDRGDVAGSCCCKF